MRPQLMSVMCSSPSIPQVQRAVRRDRRAAQVSPSPLLHERLGEDDDEFPRSSIFRTMHWMVSAGRRMSTWLAGRKTFTPMSTEVPRDLAGDALRGRFPSPSTSRPRSSRPSACADDRSTRTGCISMLLDQNLDHLWPGQGRGFIFVPRRCGRGPRPCSCSSSTRTKSPSASGALGPDDCIISPDLGGAPSHCLRKFTTPTFSLRSRPRIKLRLTIFRVLRPRLVKRRAATERPWR